MVSRVASSVASARPISGGTMEKESTLEKIRGAAVKEFARYGLDGARVDRIAQQAGINKAMIYYHYRGKEDLYENLFLEIVTQIRKKVTGMFPVDAASNRDIFTGISGYIDFLDDIDPDYARIIMRELAGGGRYFLKLGFPNLVLPVLGLISEIIESGKKEGRIKDINPLYTFFSIVAPLIFFKMVKTITMDTERGEMFFREGYLDEFKRTYFAILESGIEKIQEDAE